MWHDEVEKCLRANLDGPTTRNGAKALAHNIQQAAHRRYMPSEHLREGDSWVHVSAGPLRPTQYTEREDEPLKYRNRGHRAREPGLKARDCGRDTHKEEYKCADYFNYGCPPYLHTHTRTHTWTLTLLWIGFLSSTFYTGHKKDVSLSWMEWYATRWRLIYMVTRNHKTIQLKTWLCIPWNKWLNLPWVS